MNKHELTRIKIILRTYGLDRWNWSQKAGKWVFVEIKGKKKIYHYQIDPPREFTELSAKIKKVNEEMIVAQDDEKCEMLYTKLMKLSNQMQTMKRSID